MPDRHMSIARAKAARSTSGSSGGSAGHWPAGVTRAIRGSVPAAAASGASSIAKARQTGSPSGSPCESSSGSDSQSDTNNQTASHGSGMPESISDRAVNSPSERASGPPPIPTCGPCMPKATLTAPATECSEHCGTMWGETVTAPPVCSSASERAVAIRPAWHGAATTPQRAAATGSGSSVDASSTARTATTVCSSACRRNRVGREGAPVGGGSSRSAAIRENAAST